MEPSTAQEMYLKHKPADVIKHASKDKMETSSSLEHVLGLH